MVAFSAAGAVAGINYQSSYVVNLATYPEQPGEGVPLPGTINVGTDGTVWVFVRLAASQAVVAGDFLYISSTDATTWTATRLDNGAKAKLGAEVGVAGCTVTSDTNSSATAYTGIWMCRAGRISANVATSVAANVALYTSASGSASGRLNATSSAGTNAAVTGVVGLATAASNAAVVALNWPVIGAAQ